MMEVNVHQAKTQLSKLIAAVEGGEEVIIARNGKPAVKLSITHKFRTKDEAELDVCEACKSSPHDGVSWWRIFGSSQVASELGELSEIKCECTVGWRRSRSI